MLYEVHDGRVILHAMPVMLGVLCVLAIAYRYYSAFLAARVAALDDSPRHARPPLQRRPELPPDQQVGAVRPPLRRDLRGRAADRAGAGDPVRLHAGAALAGRRRLPGRRGAGHAGAGRLGPPRRQEPGRDRPGRDRAGRPAWPRRSRSCFIVIIALAGLGIVVVKALGGEEVADDGRDACSSIPSRRSTVETIDARTADAIYQVPPGSTYRFGDGAGPRRWPSTSRSGSAVPAGSSRSKRSPTARGCVLPEEAQRLGPGQLVGHVHHRLHDPDRAVRRLVHVPDPQGAGRRGVAHRRRRACWRRRSPAAWIPGSPLEPFFSLVARPDDLRARRLRLHRRRCCRSGCCSARATTCRASSRSAPSPCWSSA